MKLLLVAFLGAILASVANSEAKLTVKAIKRVHDEVAEVPYAFGPGDQIAFDLINSFRSRHQDTPRLAYDETLAANAVNCANQLAGFGTFSLDSYSISCADPSFGTAVGFAPAQPEVDAIRFVISDPTQRVLDSVRADQLAEPFGWFVGYNMIVSKDGVDDPFRSRPYVDLPGTPDSIATGPRDIRARPYMQMIWASAKKVGCGFSSRATDYMLPFTPEFPVASYRIVVCLFDVTANVGSFDAQLANIKPQIRS